MPFRFLPQSDRNIVLFYTIRNKYFICPQLNRWIYHVRLATNAKNRRTLIRATVLCVGVTSLSIIPIHKEVVQRFLTVVPLSKKRSRREQLTAGRQHLGERLCVFRNGAIHRTVLLIQCLRLHLSKRQALLCPHALFQIDRATTGQHTSKGL